MSTSVALSFRDVQFDIVDRSGQPWLRSQQISVALGYSRSDQAADLYARNADEFTDSTTFGTRRFPGSLKPASIRSACGRLADGQRWRWSNATRT